MNKLRFCDDGKKRSRQNAFEPKYKAFKKLRRTTKHPGLPLSARLPAPQNAEFTDFMYINAYSQISCTLKRRFADFMYIETHLISFHVHKNKDLHIACT